MAVPGVRTPGWSPGVACRDAPVRALLKLVTKIAATCYQEEEYGGPS